MWHVKYDKYITPLTIEDDRIVGVQFQIAPYQFMFIFQVYLPCRNHPIQYFKDYVDKLYNLWSIYSEQGIVVLMGDFNTSCIKNGKTDTRCLYFNQFLYDTNLIAVNTIDKCTGAKTSFVSYDGSCESLIDYILVPVELLDCVINCEVI